MKTKNKKMYRLGFSLAQEHYNQCVEYGYKFFSNVMKMIKLKEEREIRESDFIPSKTYWKGFDAGMRFYFGKNKEN